MCPCARVHPNPTFGAPTTVGRRVSRGLPLHPAKGAMASEPCDERVAELLAQDVPVPEIFGTLKGEGFGNAAIHGGLVRARRQSARAAAASEGSAPLPLKATPPPTMPPPTTPPPQPRPPPPPQRYAAQTELTALLRAACCYDEEGAIAALDAGADPAACNSDGYTALHIACQGVLVTLADALIAAGAPLEARTTEMTLQRTVVQSGGMTPLHLLAGCNPAEAGHSELARRLVRAGADVAALNADGNTPLIVALMRALPEAGRSAAPSDELIALLQPPGAGAPPSAAWLSDKRRQDAANAKEVPPPRCRPPAAASAACTAAPPRRLVGPAAPSAPSRDPLRCTPTPASHPLPLATRRR